MSRKELETDMTGYKKASLKGIANSMCKHLPENYVVHLCFENGSAWVQLERDGEWIVCPDSSDRDLLEQLNDALCLANGWPV